METPPAGERLTRDLWDLGFFGCPFEADFGFTVFGLIGEGGTKVLSGLFVVSAFFFH